MWAEHHLPPVQISPFDGSAINWPNFIELFYENVHSRLDDDGQRMVRLSSYLSGSAKRRVEGLGTAGSHYILVLKELKRRYGQSVFIARAVLDRVVNGKHISPLSADRLLNFHSDVRDCVVNLKKMCFLADISSVENVRRVSNRIPQELNSSWNKFVVGFIHENSNPTLIDFEQWLWERTEGIANPFSPDVTCNVTNRVDNERPKTGRRQLITSPFSTLTNSESVNASCSDALRCQFCNAGHSLRSCDVFYGATDDVKRNFVVEYRLCFKCLEPGHRAFMCRCDVKCSICSGKHHKCIHGIRMFESVPRPTNRQGVNNAMSVTTRVQFQLLPVLVRGANGRSEYTVALLDSASQVSLIHPKLKTKLDLRGCRKKLMLQPLAGTGISYDSEAVGCFVRDKLNPDGKELALKSVFVCDNRIPHPERRQTDFETFHHLRGIPLPDIKENEVMLLIGADHPFAHFQLERRVGGDNEPIAIRTPLGWTLLGANKRAGEVDLIQANCHLLHDDYNILQEQVKQFWSTDAIGMVYNMKRAESVEDRVAADMIRAKTSIVDGHYQVGFLWRHDASIMPENTLIARTRFKNLKYRLLKNDCLRDMYCTSMRKNIERGWVRKLTDKERDTLGPRTWYLPHHGVQNPNKPGKIRIVFDATATYCGISLNNQIYSGPDLINNLIGVLLRFRERPVALNADIEAMYHMVRLPQSDTDSVRFFWQEDLRSTYPPDVYQFLVRIFGAVDSPYVANYCLKQTALDNTSQFSTEAVETVLRDFYVDDLLSSKWNDDSAFSVAQEVSNMFSK
uniref:uncharacterized protein LOC120343883 n=1 Tax=Styela clava TaxID=7725 RepID=UPI001939AAC6|nr:uncharacterized protein LOC120343883 [Styela clava]